MDAKTVAQRIAVLLKRWLDKKASRINHREVIKDIYLEVDITAGYFLVLTLANLIALSGLITNNTAVIIGAMLISPLMGPILSSGFSFITGDSVIGRKALRKLSLSLVVTIVIAGAATFVSPLKDVTDEILARTRPNLYDLAVAVFAGTAGAIALCKKKNYMTVVPGVAIATAVIPPLSVTGYGIGTANLNIAAGGFFLFFTNFMAIIWSTCVIFYLYGFRPSTIAGKNAWQMMEKRFAGLFLVLFVISIPLFYTLHKSIREVRLRGGIHTLLKLEFDRERLSRLSTFTYLRFKDGDGLRINATVNTVKYMEETEITRVEKTLARSLEREVDLDVEQVLVRAGGLKEDQVKTAPAIAAPKTTEEETNKKTIETASAFTMKVSRDVEKIISPSTVTEFYIGFREKSSPVKVIIKIRRDAPLSEDQVHWLGKILTESMKMPVDLTVQTEPFVSPLVFKLKDTAVSEEMKRSLLPAREAYLKGPKALLFKVESFPGGSEGKNDRNWLAKLRSEEIKKILVEYGIPADRIKAVTHSRTARVPTVMVSILPEDAGPR